MSPNGERFVYDGDGAIDPAENTEPQRRTRVLFLHVDAVFPRLEAPPLVDRVEYEIARQSMGWQTCAGGYYARSNWRSRVAEVCAGYDGGYVLSMQDDERTRLLRAAMASSMPGARADVWAIKPWGHGQRSGFFLSAIRDSLATLRACGRSIGEISVYLNEDWHFREAVHSGLAVTEGNLIVNVRNAHPTLELFAEHLPLPEEFTELDEWLDLNAPMPGTIKPGDGQ